MSIPAEAADEADLRMRPFHVAAAALLGATFCSSAVPAQGVPWTSLPVLGSDAEDRSRLAQLLGRADGASFLLRSPSDSLDTLPGDLFQVRWSLLEPVAVAVNNSSIPFSLNNGPLWAARGWSEDLRAGLHAQWGPFSLVLAPELVVTENLWYEMPPPQVELQRPPGRSPYSTPWYVGAYSIDLPLRFGERGFSRLDPGQSTLSVDFGAVTAGLSTENEWWGPGIRNAIVMSDNAPGIPRAFVRTSRPVRTRLGTFAARWFLGELTQSAYFDTATANRHRSITGLAVTWTPAGAPHLTLGFTRVVYAPLPPGTSILGHTFDVLRGSGMRQSPGDSVALPNRDQISSLFFRWILPADGFAVHAEWARTRWPSSLRDFLTDPNYSQGYTFGLEWARPLQAGRNALRVQAEATYLEKSPAYRYQREETWYTSGASPQGYTQEGQVIGAAIGPGASSQWLAVDYFAPKWRVGVFGGRIRWNDDALYLFPSYYTNKWCSHDVSLFGGVTAAVLSPWGKVETSFTAGERLNMFFYHLTWCGPTAARIDVLDERNNTLRLSFTAPAL